MADIFDDIEADVESLMNDIGIAMVAGARERIAINVEYATGPRGGKIVIRSKPGEPPRRETGELWSSLDHAVTNDGDIVLNVSSDSRYAAPLEFGAPVNNLLPRPFLLPTFEAWADTIEELIANTIQNPSRQAAVAA